MIELQDIIKEVLNRTGYDQNIVSAVCKHPFNFTINVMKNENDIKDILFNRLFKFKLKRRYREDKTKKYTIK